MITLLDWSGEKQAKNDVEGFLDARGSRIIRNLLQEAKDLLLKESFPEAWDKLEELKGLLSIFQIAIDAVSHIDAGKRIIEELEATKAQYKEAQQ